MAHEDAFTTIAKCKFYLEIEGKLDIQRELIRVIYRSYSSSDI